MFKIDVKLELNKCITHEVYTIKGMLEDAFTQTGRFSVCNISSLRGVWGTAVRSMPLVGSRPNCIEYFGKYQSGGSAREPVRSQKNGDPRAAVVFLEVQ